MDSTRESRVKVEKLQRELESYKSYLDEETYNNFSSTLGKIKTNYDSHLSGAETRSRFDSEEAYNDAIAALKSYEELKTFDIASAENRIAEINNELGENGNPIAGFFKDFFATTEQNQSSEKLKDERTALEVKVNKAKRIQNYETLTKEAVNATDLDEYVKQGEAKGLDTHSAFAGTDGKIQVFGSDVNNRIIAFRNNRTEDGIPLASFAGAATNAHGIDEYAQKFAQYMTDEEYQIYTYHYGKYGDEKAEEYLDSIEEQINARQAGIYFDNVKDNLLLEYAFGITAGLDQFSSGIENLFSDEDYIPISSIQTASGMVKEDLADDGFNLPEWMGGASVGQVGYDIVTTTSNMLPSILVSYVPVVGQVTGAALLGASAAGNAKAEMLRLGYSKEAANSYGLLVGASEGVLQYALGGISKLGGKVTGNAVGKFVSKFDNAIARTAIKIGGNMASEGLEESLQSVLEPVFKSITTGEEFEGINWEEVVYSGLLGALSAGILEGGGTVAGEINTYKEGKNIKGDTDALERLTKLGSTMSADSIAYKLAGKIDENTGAYTIGRLLNEVGASLSEQNISDIVKSLERKGVTSTDAQTIAKWLNKAVEGKSFSKKQIAVLESNDVVSKTFADVIVNQNSTVWQRINGHNELRKLAETQVSAPKTSPTQAKATTATKGSPEEKKATDSKFAVSESGKTTQVSTDEEITIDKSNAIKKIEVVDGERIVYLNTDHGAVKSSDISYANKDEALIYESFVDMNPAFANAVIKNYDGSVPIQTYINGMREGIVIYGMHNFQAVGKDISKDSYLAQLSEADQSFALKLGRNYAKADAKKAEAPLRKAIKNAAEKAASEEKTSTNTKAKKGKVYFENGAKPMMKHKKTVTLAKHLANAIGINIAFYDATIAGTKHSDSNGYYDKDTNTIHLDLQNAKSDAKTIAFTLSHELVHFIKDKSPTQFNTFAKFLMEQYAEHGVNTSTLLSNKMAELGTTDADYAYEEMIADACETLLLDSNAVYKLMELRRSDLNLFETIKLHIHELLSKIRAEYKKLGLQPTSDEAKALLKMEDVLEQIYSKFEDALVEATQNYQVTIGTRNLEDFAKAETTDGKTLFQYKAIKADENTYKNMLKKWGKMSETQINNLFNTIDTAVDIIKDNLEALDYAWEADIDDRAFSPVKPNSDKLYQVSLDFSTLCRKRILQQTVATQLQEALNKPLTREEGIAIRDALIALQEEGRQIEVACALCYVESARMKSPDQIKRFFDNKEAVIREFFAGKSGGDIKAKIKKAEADAREKLHKENILHRL